MFSALKKEVAETLVLCSSSLLLLLLLLLLFLFVDSCEHINEPSKHIKQGCTSPGPNVARATIFVEWRVTLVGPKNGICFTPPSVAYEKV